MRILSRLASALASVLAMAPMLLAVTSCLAQSPGKTGGVPPVQEPSVAADRGAQCSPTSFERYPGNGCVVSIDRDKPSNPLPYQVPGGTTVTIEITNARRIESVQFNSATEEIAKPDILGALVKQIIEPLKSLTISTKGRFTLASDPINDEQQHVSDQLAKVASAINKATVELTCIQTYTAAKEENGVLSCSQDSLDKNTFEEARNRLVSDISGETGAS